MAQIFIAHSKEDTGLRGLFTDAFAGTKVKGVFEEFEKILTGKITPSKVRTDIESSNAIFVILSQNVQNIPHTRDWVVSEASIAANRDVWIFEPYLQFGRISVVTPYLRHYVIFEISDAWLGYIRGIIESYDDSHVLLTVLVNSLMGGGIGAALAEKDKTGGAVLGGIGGIITGLKISDKSKERPKGLNVVCVNCHSSYNIHIPQGMTTFRCPVCNTDLEIKM